MEVGAQDNGAGERGAWPGCGYAPFTFGALGDVYVCENERKEGRKEASVFALALRRMTL